MKTNKKLKLNTKKVIILSDDQQNAVQGGGSRRPLCVQQTDLQLCGSGTTFGGDCGSIGCGGQLSKFPCG